MRIKYPDVHIKLAGEDGTAFSILHRVRRAMRRQGVSVEEVHAYDCEATAGDYDNLIRTTMLWVSCDEPPDDDQPSASAIIRPLSEAA